MRQFYIFVVLLVWVVRPVGGVAQNAQYTLADTAWANQMLIESNLLSIKGECDSAIVKAKLANSIFEQTIGEESYLTALSWYYIANGYVCKNQCDSAIINNKKVLAFIIKSVGNKHEVVKHSYNDLGLNYLCNQDTVNALICFMESLYVAWTAFPPNHKEIYQCYRDINTCILGNDEKASVIWKNLMGERRKNLEIEDPEISYLRQRIIFTNWGDIEFCKKALTEEIQLKKLVEDNIDLIFSSLAKGYEKLDAKDSTVILLENNIQQIERSTNKNLRLLSFFHRLAGKYLRRNGNNKCIEQYQKAIFYRTKFLNTEYDSIIAGIYYDIGKTYHDSLNHKLAIINYQKALNIQLKILDENDYDIKNSYRQLAYCYNAEKEHMKAVEFYKKAIPISIKNYGTKSSDVAQMYLYLGANLYNLGENDNALEYFQEALHIFKNYHPDEKLAIAQAYNDIGLYLESKGEQDSALVFYKNALNIQLNNLKNIDTCDLIYSYNNIGAIYKERKKYDLAIEYLDKATDLMEKHTFENSSIRIKPYENFVWAVFWKVQELIEKGDTSYYANPILSKAPRYYNKLDDLKNSFDYLKAGKIRKEGDEQLDSSKIENADSLYSETLKILKFSTIDSLDNIVSLYDLGKTLESIGKLNEKKYFRDKNINHLYAAIKKYQEAYKALIAYRDNFKSATSNSPLWTYNYISVLRNAVLLSTHLFELTGNSQYKKEIFNYMEEAKASILYEALKESKAKQMASIPDSILEKEKDIRIKINFTEKKKSEISQKGNKTTIDSLILSLNNDLINTRQEYDVFKKSLEKNYPKYYRLKYDRKVVNLDYIQDTLLRGTDKSLISYFIGDSSIFIFAVKNGKDKILLKGIKKDFPLEEWVKQIREGIYGYYSISEEEKKKYSNIDSLNTSKRSQYINAACNLYQKLIAPIDSFITNRVIIIPDGVLGYVPFDALLKERPRTYPNGTYRKEYDLYKYWGDSTIISYAYSATSLKEMIDKQHQAPPQYKNSILAFAPFYKRKTLVALNDEVRGINETNPKTLKDLNASGTEVDNATRLIKGNIRTSINANKERLLQEAPNYRIIHFATHAEANDKVGENAFIALGVANDTTQYEPLYVKDIYNLTLNADLVTLSACETGIGELKRGEGIISIARAFAYAGAKSIVTTLWSINDGSTADLMTYFYENIKSGMDKDIALWQAKKTLRDRGVFIHPYYWSAFLPIGDMKRIELH